MRHLEHYFTLLNVGDGNKTTLLIYYLGNEASNTAFHLNITDATNYDDAKEALMQYFSPVETPEELHTKFYQRYQKPNEILSTLRSNCAFSVPRLISPWDQMN